MRSIFLSDCHIKSPYCNLGNLAAFIESLDCEYLYLVGDIIDFEHPKGESYSDKRVIETLFSLPIRNKTYVVGNHDIVLLKNLHDKEMSTYLQFFKENSWRLCRRAIHTSLRYGKYLVIHGDSFPNRYKNKGLFKYYYPLIGIKDRIDLIPLLKLIGVFYLREFEKEGIKESERSYCDGVITGHTHCPKVSKRFINCGDWVYHNTAVGETNTGEFVILKGD